MTFAPIHAWRLGDIPRAEGGVSTNHSDSLQTPVQMIR